MSIFRRLRSLFFAHFTLKSHLFWLGVLFFLHILSGWKAKLPKQIGFVP